MAVNIRLVVEYDGTELAGWQRQDNAPTVQQHLEEALTRMTGEPVTLVGASRTDAGVHALGQVANFHTDSTIPTHGLRRGLNSTLPPAIAVREVSEVAADFHARFGASGKHYRYSLLARPERSPLARLVSWHRPRPLDSEAMAAAAAHLVGEHDFAAFRAVGCAARTTVRRVTAATLERDGDLLHLHVRGTGFLRNMVRIIAGTLVDVGEGRLCAADLPAVLAAGERQRAGQTAPARGLCLMRVLYPPEQP